MNKVFGIGLPKTGTTTLNVALQLLGLTAYHNPKELWEKLHMGIYEYPDVEFDALTHFAFNQYRVLDRFYPECKFIYTHRDKGDWLESCERQFSAAFIYEQIQAQIRIDAFGTCDFDRQHFSSVYDRHFSGAVDFFNDLTKAGRSDRWLDLDVCDGESHWDELCDFLNLPNPHCPWPRANSWQDLVDAAKADPNLQIMRPGYIIPDEDFTSD
jgi:hypothetical protein